MSVFPSTYPEYVYNFAYGSNMNHAVLTGRRKICPAESIPAVLSGWQLTFDLRGIPAVEPAFGNIKPNPAAEIHGVAHKITGEEFRHLLSTEGGGGVSSDGYIPTLFNVTAYDGRTISAYALVVKQTSPNISSHMILPSSRYINLLITGAKHHNIHPQYIQYLESLPFHTKSKPILALILIFLLFLLVLLFPIYFPVVLFHLCMGRQIHAKHFFLRIIADSLWKCYQLCSCATGKPYDSAAFPINSTDFRLKFAQFKQKYDEEKSAKHTENHK